MTEAKIQPSETVQNERDERDDNEDVSAQVQTLRSQGLSYQEIGSKLGISKSKAFRMGQGRKDQAATVPARFELDEPLDDSSIPNQPVDLMSDTDLTIEAKRLKKRNEVLTLRAKNAYLSYVAQNPEAFVNRWNGNDGHGSHDNEAIRDLKQEIREIKQSVQNNPLGYIKVGADSFKSGMDSVSRGPNVDPLALSDRMWSTYRAGIQDATNLQATSNQKTEIDVRLAEMAETERLENKKLDWEMMKHQEAKDSEKQLYGIIKDIGVPLAQKLTTAAGGAAVRKIEGQPKPINIIDVPCPKCQQPIKTVEGTKQIVCQSCGTVLEALQTQPQPQPSPEPQHVPAPQETETEETQMAVLGQERDMNK